MALATNQKPTTTATNYNHNHRILQQIPNPKTSTKLKKKKKNLKSSTKSQPNRSINDQTQPTTSGESYGGCRNFRSVSRASDWWAKIDELQSASWASDRRERSVTKDLEREWEREKKWEILPSGTKEMIKKFMQHATMRFHKWNHTVACCKKILRFGTSYETWILVFGVSNIKYLAFDTPNGNALIVEGYDPNAKINYNRWLVSCCLWGWWKFFICLLKKKKEKKKYEFF